MTYLWIILELTALAFAEPDSSETSETTEEAPSETPVEEGTENSDSPSTEPEDKKSKAKKSKKEKQKKDTEKDTEMIDETTVSATGDSETIPSSGSTVVISRPYFWAGMEMAPIVSTSDLGAGFLPQIEIGAQLPYLNRMFGLVFYGSYHNSKTSGKGDIVEMPESTFSYDMIQREGELGLSFRTVFPQVPVVQPEIWLGPTVQLLQSEVIGKIDSQKYPTSTEQNTRIGFHAAILGSYVLPVGQVYGGCHYTTYMWRNLIQGEARSHLISPTVGFRYQFPK